MTASPEAATPKTTALQPAKGRKVGSKNRPRPIENVIYSHPLRAWRLKYGVSQDDLATACGSSKTTISRLEAGLREPTAALMRRLIDATKGEITADALLAWKKSTPKKARRSR